ncbi:MAG: ABC transporter ATP-binding protein [Leifsonia sp.]
MPSGSPFTGTSSGVAVAVDFAGVGRAFDPGRPVLAGVDLHVEPGEIVAIIGASGCGKSTLLRIAGGLDVPTSGVVQSDGSAVATFAPRPAVGFPEPRRRPGRSIADNVALGVPRGTARAAACAGVDHLLALVGLTDAAGQRPREVSGGMAQRASLARALARRPGVLLLDEPFGALDALTRLRMQDLLLDIHSAQPTTVLLVTHDVDEALQLSDRIVLIGRSAETGPATVLETVTVPGRRPRDRGSAELAELRARLLDGLGIDRHGHARGVETTTTIPAFPY